MVKNVGTLSEIVSLSNTELEMFIKILPNLQKVQQIFKNHTGTDVDLSHFQFNPLKADDTDLLLELAHCTYLASKHKDSERNRDEQIKSLTETCIEKDETIASLEAEIAELKGKYDLLVETLKAVQVNKMTPKEDFDPFDLRRVWF